MATENDVTYGFNREQAMELVNGLGQRDFSLRLYESNDSNGGGGSVIVKTGSGGIAAMSGDTPGRGTVTIYTDDGTDLVATSDTVTAINISTTAHPANCYTTAKIAGGVYVLADPAVTDLRLSGLSLQLRRNCDWSTWVSGEECDEESGGGPEEEPLP